MQARLNNGESDIGAAQSETDLRTPFRRASHQIEPHQYRLIHSLIQA